MGLFSKFIAKIKGTNDFSPADWAELEQELLASDLGPTLTKNFLEAAKKVKSENAELALIEILTGNLSKNLHEPVLVAGTTTIMVVGVNGTGKTTSVAKLASYYKKSGKSVVLAAGDTFRAAAVDQLKTWGSRIGVQVVSGKDNGDPASVAFDGAKSAHESASDVFIIDTIGILTKIYSYADIAYVGGGFGHPGVHNILEPATFGIPIVIGPNYSHFAEAIDLVRLGGCISIKNSEQLNAILNELIVDSESRKCKGSISTNFVQNNAGAVARIMKKI